MIIFGSRKAKIGSYDVFMYQCPFCEQNNSTRITVLCIYYHIFFIPFFPYAKDAIANCNNCNASMKEINFGPKLIEEFRETKKNFKYPWWTWLWVIIFLLLILTIFIVAPK
jgi:ribosomal protein L37AE/L43A